MEVLFEVKFRSLTSVVVLIHKSLFALVMGLAALRTLEGLTKPILVMLVFSVASPIGIGIGAIVFKACF